MSSLLVAGNQNNLRSAAYEALMEMMKNSPKDCYPVVTETTVIILDRLQRILQMEVSTIVIKKRSSPLGVHSSG